MKKRTRKTFFRRALRWLGLLLTLLLCAGALALSPPGLRRLTPTIERVLARALDAPVQIEGLEFGLPLHLRLERFVLGSAAERRVDIRHASVSLSLRELRRRNLWFHHLHVHEIHFQADPSTAEAPQPRKPPGLTIDLPDIPRLLDRLTVTSLHLGTVRVERVPGSSPLVASVVGSWTPVAFQAGRKLDMRITALETTDEAPSSFRIHGTLDAGPPVMATEIEWDWPHRAQGRLRLHGDPAAPEAELTATLSNLLPAPVQAPEMPAPTLTVHAQLAAMRLQVEAELASADQTWATVRGSAPLHLSFDPGRLHFAPDGPVDLALASDLDLRRIAPLFLPEAHILSGTLQARLGLSGSLQDPNLTGHIQLENGAYEHERSGTLLRDLDLALSGSRDRLAIDRFSATDGHRGRLEVRGALRLREGGTPEIDGRLDLERFRLFRNEFGHAYARGSLVLDGTRADLSLHGRMAVSPVELTVPERLPVIWEELDVIEIDGDVPPDPAADPEPDPAPGPRDRSILNLDVVLDFPDRVFLRGRGLDSEWLGRLHVEGTAMQPEISGSLGLARGRFVFLGRRLTLSQGSVSLDGAFPPEPLLDVMADARVGDVEASLRLSGPVHNPEITLSSTPEMPEDEILAYLLFGREPGRISPWQAVLLAQALHQLRTGESAFDFMGETRRVLGVDEIDVRPADDPEGGQVVRVGRHVGERIYVVGERGIGAEERRVVLEIEITPELRLENEIGGAAESGVNLRWRRDY